MFFRKSNKPLWFDNLKTVPSAENQDDKSDLCFIDIETTGSLFGFHEIIELAAMRTSADASIIRTTWYRKIRPLHPYRLSPKAAEMNAFETNLWADACQPSRALWTDFVTFAKGSIPVCHNPSFERAFITLAATEQRVFDLEIDYHWIGTETLAWPLLVSGKIPALGLDELCSFFQIEPEPRPHTAQMGVQTCMEVYRRLMAKYSFETSDLAELESVNG